MKEEVAKICEILRSGGVILYPTDTVWGIGCDATNPAAVQKVYDLKQRAETKAMIVLVSSVDALLRHTTAPAPVLGDLLDANQGSGTPLTVIVPRGCGVAPNVLPEEGSLAMRVPEHLFCEALLRAFRRPLVSTSANLSGQNTPLSFSAISPAIKQGVDYVVPQKFESGATGKPSSIIMVDADNSVKIIR